MASRNLPPLGEMEVPRACNLIWYWATKGGDQNEIEKFRLRLWQPPAHETGPAQGPWSAEEETAAFGKLKAALNK